MPLRNGRMRQPCWQSSYAYLNVWHEWLSRKDTEIMPALSPDFQQERSSKSGLHLQNRSSLYYWVKRKLNRLQNTIKSWLRNMPITVKELQTLHRGPKTVFQTLRSYSIRQSPYDTEQHAENTNIEFTVFSPLLVIGRDPLVAKAVTGTQKGQLRLSWNLLLLSQSTSLLTQLRFIIYCFECTHRRYVHKLDMTTTVTAQRPAQCFQRRGQPV